jgi:hypothetical protein
MTPAGDPGSPVMPADGGQRVSDISAVPEQYLRSPGAASCIQVGGLGADRLRTVDCVGPEEVVQLIQARDGRLVAEGVVWSAAVVEVKRADEGGVLAKEPANSGTATQTPTRQRSRSG